MVKLTMLNDEEMELTLSHGLISRVEKERPELEEYTRSYYDSLTSNASETPKEMIERIYRVIYVAYLCTEAKQGNLKNAVSYDEFELMLPENDTEIMAAMTGLINPNRAKASAKPSKSTQKR